MDAIKIAKEGDASFIREVEKDSGQNVLNCYQCGNCTAGCPAAMAYDLQAHQLMRGVQLGLKEQVLGSKSIWMCLSCSTCSLRCPNSIDVAAVMESLRHMARREKRFTVPKVDKFWLSFLETVRHLGRAYEIGTMALFMLRSGRLWTDVDLAPEALKKQKLPFIPHTIKGDDGAEAVSRIFERYKARCAKEADKQ